MKKSLLLFSMLLFSTWAKAENIQGQIVASLTLVKMCSVNATEISPQVTCSHGAALVPNITHSKPQGNGEGVELITVEW